MLKRVKVTRKGSDVYMYNEEAMRVLFQFIELISAGVLAGLKEVMVVRKMDFIVKVGG